MSNPEMRADLMIAKRLSKQLVKYEEDRVSVWCNIYFGRKMWKLSLQKLYMDQLRPQFRS